MKKEGCKETWKRTKGSRGKELTRKRKRKEDNNENKMRRNCGRKWRIMRETKGNERIKQNQKKG